VPPQGLTTKFGALVRKHRQAENLSQEALAERAGLHPTYIGLIERHKRIPTLEVAERIARGLRLKLSEIISEAERQVGG
jgi:transcriptional regulator with XRE-family HTH domain